MVGWHGIHGICEKPKFMRAELHHSSLVFNKVFIFRYIQASLITYDKGYNNYMVPIIV